MEACVENITSAQSAARGGAIRLELCASLVEGGLTPSVGILKVIKSVVSIPVFVMIRPNGGHSFIYSPDEIQSMEFDLKLLKDNGADGFVFGILDNEHNVDEVNCKKLLHLADPLPCTFHRAFDIVSDPFRAMETIISLGFKRILTSGQQKTAELGISLIKDLINRAGDRIIVMPGAGINEFNLETILKETKAKEFHGSAKKTLDIAANDVFENFSKALYCDESTVKRMVAIASNVWR